MEKGTVEKKTRTGRNSLGLSPSSSTSKSLDSRMRTIFRHSTFAIGAFSIALLMALSVIGFLTFGFAVRDTFTPEKGFGPDSLVKLLDTVLLIFIVIELLNIAIAFVEGRKVILTVFEAVLVAVARKIIASGTDPIDLDKAASLSLITVAVGVTWWLVTHAEDHVNPNTSPGKAAQFENEMSFHQTAVTDSKGSPSQITPKRNAA